MRVAQGLYENGYITYMRTDSTNLSQEAIAASRRAIEKRYGSEYLSERPRQYKGKAKNAQEAHEAIRPAGKQMKTREEQKLSGIEGSAVRPHLEAHRRHADGGSQAQVYDGDD